MRNHTIATKMKLDDTAHNFKHYLKIHGIYPHTTFRFMLNNELHTAKIIKIDADKATLSDIKYRMAYTLTASNINNFTM